MHNVNFLKTHMQNYHPPEYKKSQFHCIHCGVYSFHSWQNFYYWNKLHAGYSIHKPLEFCLCEHCQKGSYWYEERMVVPAVALVPPAHVDMPQQCIADYDEARGIVAVSARAATALLRLALQKLMVALGEKGKNIHDDIDSLVKKGLPVEVRQVLDACGIAGGNATRLGEIEVNDTAEIAYHLFSVINFVVEDRISRPTSLQSLFAQLPTALIKAEEKHDGPDH